MNILLVIVIAIILLSGVMGYKKGLIKTVLSMATIILSIILTSIVAPEVSDILCANETVHDKVYDMVSENIDLEEVTKELSKVTGEKLDEAVQSEILDKIGLPPIVKEIIINSGNLEQFTNKNAVMFEEYLFNILTDLIINAAAYVIVFVIVSILLVIVASVLNLISKLPILKSLNRMAGAAIGVIEGFVIVWLLFILLSVFPGNDTVEKCNTYIEENEVLTYLYDNNIIMSVVSDYAEEMENEYAKEIMDEIKENVENVTEADEENADK